MTRDASGARDAAPDAKQDSAEGSSEGAKQPQKLSEKLDKAASDTKKTEKTGSGRRLGKAADKGSGARADTPKGRRLEEQPPRRTAGPARRHIAANDDLPSIGGLIYALQQRPSNSPFLFALGSSIVWLILGGGVGWALLSANMPATSGFAELAQQPAALVVAATIIVPIALFWFLALLIWRAQELRLMASAMTEVAIRLAEPDKMAEQSVASLGQAIRRQVAAMNDAISRALGRAGELEALVHNEVAALENSYGENELRIRRLIDELSSEREALANNSERVSGALRGVGSQVSADIAAMGEQTTKSLASATTAVADALTAKGGKITAAITAAGTAIDNRVAERGAKVAEALQSTSQKAADMVDVKANSLFQSLTGVSDQLAKEIPGLMDRLDGEQKRLNSIISAATQNFTELETTIARRTSHLGSTIQGRGQELTTALTESGARIDDSLNRKTEEIKTALGQGGAQLNTALSQNTEAIKAALGEGGAQLDATLGKSTEAIKSALGEGGAQLNTALSQNTEAIKAALGEGGAQLNTALSQNTEAIKTALGEGGAQLNTALSQNTEAIKTTLGEGGAQLGDALTRKADEIKAAFSESGGRLEGSLTRRTEEIKAVLTERIKALDGSVSQHAKSIDQSLSKNTMALSQVLAEGSDAVTRTTAQMVEGSDKATANMDTQAAVLRDTSKRMLDQIHNLTQRFEQQGQAIMTAAQALDSSNAKIDSILERRHAEISSLMENVSTKAVSLDKMMRSYSGIIESSLVQVEKRAKDVSDALARESAVQSRATLEEIERLRDSTRTQTEQAVRELQSSFQTIGHQVADQLKTLTSQFGSSTRQMRQTASQTASEIESTRQELQRRMRDLPEAARQSSAVVREAVSEQMRALDSLSAIAAESAPRDAVPAPQPARAPESPPAGPGNGIATLLPQFPFSGSGLRPSDHDAPASPASSPPAPPPQPRQSEPEDDLASVASGLAQQLGRAGTPRPAATAPGNGGVRLTGGPPQPSPRDRWSVGDLLARASEPEAGGRLTAPPQPQRMPTPPALPAGGGELRLSDLAGALDQQTAADIWQRYQRGEQDIFSRQQYSYEGQLAFDEISQRYRSDATFRTTVDRYIGDFEYLLSEAQNKGQDAAALHTYLTSETGRVYLVLAHASGRLR